MITTVNVAISWSKAAPRLSDEPIEHLSLKDPRVLLGVQQALARRTGVMQAPDLVSASSVPHFVVALDDTNYGQTTPLLGELTDPIRLRIAFAADGGWKVVLADIAVEVI